MMISVVTFSISTILQRKTLKNDSNDPLIFSIPFQLITGTGIAFVGLFAGTLGFPQNTVDLLPNLFFTMIAYGCGSLLLFKGLQQVQASEFTVLFTSRAFFSIIASFVFLDEMLTLQQGFGAILIFVGIIIVSNMSLKHVRFTKGELITLAAACCFGIANTNDRYVLQSFDVYTYVSLSFLLPALLLTIIFFKKLLQADLGMFKRSFCQISLFSFFYIISSIGFFSALQQTDNSSQIITLNQTSTILTVLFGIVFLQERNNVARKVLGAFISFIGVLLVI